TITEVYLDNCNQFQLSDNIESKQAQALSKSFYSLHFHLHDDFVQKISKFDSLEQFNFCQNCSQLLLNDNFLHKHLKSKTCVTDMISLFAVSESSVKKKNSSAVQ